MKIIKSGKYSHLCLEVIQSLEPRKTSMWNRWWIVANFTWSLAFWKLRARDPISQRLWIIVRSWMRKLTCIQKEDYTMTPTTPLPVHQNNPVSSHTSYLEAQVFREPLWNEMAKRPPTGWSNQMFCVQTDTLYNLDLEFRFLLGHFFKLFLLIEKLIQIQCFRIHFLSKTYKVLLTRGVWRKGYPVKEIIVPLKGFFFSKFFLVEKTHWAVVSLDLKKLSSSSLQIQRQYSRHRTF